MQNAESQSNLILVIWPRIDHDGSRSLSRQVLYHGSQSVIENHVQNVRILLVESCPNGYQPLAIRRERHAIEGVKRESGFRDSIAIDVAPGACFRHLQAALNQKSTEIVHFFGHGSQERELLFEDDQGEVKPIGADDFAHLFGCLTERVRLVICNACHSRHHAEAVVAHVDHAIGMDGAVDDETARLFATTFYTAVFAGAPVAKAFEQARAVCRAEGMVSADVFVLASRPGCLEDRLFVPDESNRESPDEPDDESAHGFTIFPAKAVHPARRSLAASRFLQRGTLWVAGAAALAVLILAVIAALWPPLNVPAFPDRAGVLVAGPWLGRDDTRQAVRDLVSELDAIAPQRVHHVALPRVGVSDAELLSGAKAAGARLVVRVEDGPVARILYVPGTRKPWVLESVPAVRLANRETHRLLAHVLHVMAWSTMQDPTTLPRPIEIPVPGQAELPRQLTILAILFGEYKGQHGHEWRQGARDAIRPIVQACRGSFGEHVPDEWSCSLAGYIYYALLCPECPGASARLENLRTQSPEFVADAATLETMKRECSDSPRRVSEMLIKLNGAWPMGACRRLALAPPAQCLITKHGYPQVWLKTLSDPPLDRFAHCGDMPARVLAERASLLTDAGRWREAADLYWRAVEHSRGGAIYLVSWAIAEFMRKSRPGDLAVRLEAELSPDRIESDWAIAAEFLLWLATDDSHHAERLCGLYAGVESQDVAVRDLRHLGERLCLIRDEPTCRAYRVLVMPRIGSSMNELARAVGDVAGCDQ